MFRKLFDPETDIYRCIESVVPIEHSNHNDCGSTCCIYFTHFIRNHIADI